MSQKEMRPDTAPGEYNESMIKVLEGIEHVRFRHALAVLSLVTTPAISRYPLLLSGRRTERTNCANLAA